MGITQYWLKAIFCANCRTSGVQLQTLLMFAILVAFLPFAFGVEAKQLQQTAVAFMWFEALIIQILAMPQLFQTDYEDGTIEVILMSHISITYYFILKIFIFWLFYGCALACSTFILGILFSLAFSQIFILFISLLVGSLALTMLVAIGAALNLAVEKGTTVSTLFILPLSVPVLIFGVAAAYIPSMFENGIIRAEFYGLFGLLLLYSVLSIISVPVLLRIMVSR